MKLAVAYAVKLLLVWATFSTIYQLVKTFREDYNAYKDLPPKYVRFSIRVCFDYKSVIVIHQSNNETAEDCVQIFGEHRCNVWRQNGPERSRYYLKGFVPRKFIEFGRRVFIKNEMITAYNTSLYDRIYYLAQKMLCINFRKNADFPDDFFEMKVNSKYQIPNQAAEKIQIRLYINNPGSYPDKNDYIFSASLKELRDSGAMMIFLQHEMLVEDYPVGTEKEFLRQVRAKHRANKSLRFCQYNCERKYNLHNQALLYLDEDRNVELSEDKLRDKREVKEIEDCVLKDCPLSNEVNDFFTVAGLGRIAKEEWEEFGKSDGQSEIYIWFYRSTMVHKRPKLALIDFVVNIGFAFSLYFGYNLIGVNSIAERLVKQKWRLNKLCELALLFVSIFFFVIICGYYYEQISECDYSHYSMFLPEFSSFTFSVCFPLANMLKNSNQTFNQIPVRDLDEMTLGLKDVTVGFSLINMATLKRSNIQLLFNNSRPFYFRMDKCFAFNVDKNVIRTDRPFSDEKLREVYFRLFDRYLQLHLIFNQTFLIYVTEHGQLPYYFSEFTNDPMIFLKREDKTERGNNAAEPKMQIKYKCKLHTECMNKCILSKTLPNDTDGSLSKKFQYDAVVEPSQLDSSLLDHLFVVLDRNESIKLESDCLHEFNLSTERSHSFSSYISSRALGMSELLLLQLSMSSDVYSENRMELFDVILNLLGCYFLIFGSSFYSAASLFKTYMKNYIILKSNRSVLSKELRFVQETPDKFWKAFFDVSFILTCIAGLSVLLLQTYRQVQHNPIVARHQVSKYGYLTPPSLILCFPIGLIGTNNTRLLYNYTHLKNRHHNYTAAQLMNQTKDLSDFVKKVEFMHSNFRFAEISNKLQMEQEYHDNLRIRTFFYSMNKCFSFSVNFRDRYHKKFLAGFESSYIKNAYLKTDGSHIFKITLNEGVENNFPPMIVYLETDLFLMNEPMIRLKNKSLSIDYKAFFQLPINQDFQFCLGKFNNETPLRMQFEQIDREMNRFNLGQFVSPDFPVFEESWNRTLFSFDESSLENLDPLRMLYEPLMAINLTNITEHCILDYITHLREISLSEGDNFILVRHNAPDFIFSRSLKYSRSEIFLSFGNVLSLWFGISFDSFISILLKLFEDSRKFARLVLSGRAATNRYRM